MVRYRAQMESALEGSKLVGHAAVFNQVAYIPQSRNYERMAPTAFDEALKTSDAAFLVNHNPSQLLGRQSSETLKLSTDSQGLAFEVELPNTTLGNDVRELLARGDLKECSFAFVPGKDTFENSSEGAQIRTHTSVSSLLDASVVTYPAYDGTDIALRSMDLIVMHESRRSQLIKSRAKALFQLRSGV